MKNRNKYRGSWTEPVARKIELPHTVESLKKVLTWGALPDTSPYTHQDIVQWCDRFHMAMFDIDTNESMNLATGVAADVDAQWDLYLANTYTLEQLQKLDFAKERIPQEWFRDWLKQLEAA